MVEENTTSVSAAFEMLLEEIETEVELINALGARAFQASDYDGVDHARERIKGVTDFRDRIAALNEEWDAFVAGYAEEDEEEETLGAERRNLGRLKRGLRTPNRAYFVPILTVLERNGGSAKSRDIIDQIEPLMKGVLKDVDYEPLASDPNWLRWRNAATWSRHRMVLAGLLRDDSPRGTWEITDKGRQFLTEQGK